MGAPLKVIRVFVPTHDVPHKIAWSDVVYSYVKHMDQDLRLATKLLTSDRHGLQLDDEGDRWYQFREMFGGSIPYDQKIVNVVIGAGDMIQHLHTEGAYNLLVTGIGIDPWPKGPWIGMGRYDAIYTPSPKHMEVDEFKSAWLVEHVGVPRPILTPFDFNTALRRALIRKEW
jgi:hypothetical protein